MGIKKLVTMTVEVEIEIELSESLANPSAEDIEGINYCSFDVKNSDDIYKEAARLVLLGYDDCNNDVFGYIKQSWAKGLSTPPEATSFYNLKELYIEDFKVEEINAAILRGDQ
ncbi:hypothetical protein [Acinetobacter sp. WCHAc060025]|uniref:hypothetical protein n=1 Tax=Acinetobacter sp. WCHAc060025 TaxID=2518625 RepID=UPI001022CBB5|nr:hypothetical protein [Acinetobacter sp. WCHAc060025]RZG74759.1 hypothetical protein EXE09_12270 [Acinetobacter sp. WCHAc060025]